MTSQSGQQLTTINILHNVSGSNGNQVMKFGQLIKQNAINILLQKSY